MELGEALLCVALKLILIQEILLRMATPKEEQGWTYLFTLCLERRALLQEAHKRSQAGPGAYHNDGKRWISGMMKGRACILHKAIDDLTGRAAAQEERADPLMHAV